MLSLLQHLNASRLWQVPVAVRGHRFRPPTLDRLAALLLFRLGLAGREEFELFRSVLRPGMTVADIGANQGVFTLYFADLVGPGGRVVAFEPEPVMFAALEGNLRASGKAWVEPHNLALGAEAGEVTLQISNFNRGNNRLIKGPLQSVADGPTATVRVATLDEVMGGARVDFVKMDVQGWEGAVLRGMSGLLSSPEAPLILLEVYPDGIRKAGDTVEGLFELLPRHGYSLRQADAKRAPLDLERIARLRGTFGFTNALAVPPRLAAAGAASSI